MTKQNPGKSDLSVGFGKSDITPSIPFPMAGIIDRKGRFADKAHSPLFARALAFSDNEKVVLVVSADLLLITNELRREVWKRLSAQNISFEGMMISATHTHSAPGGFWNTRSAKSFMGDYNKETFELIAGGICKAACMAVKDLQDARIYFGETQTQGLNYNRRHKDGPIDRTLGLLTIKRKTKDIQVAFFGAHPVVTAFREYNTASADYPGEVVKSMEANGDHGMFMVGPVGGVNVLFPEGPMELDVHYSLLNRLLMEQIEIAKSNQTSIKGHDVAFAFSEVDINLTLPKLLPDYKFWLDILLLPLRLWINNFGKKGMGDKMTVRIPVVRVGELIFTGFPADNGAGVGLEARRIIAKKGYKTAVAASQTDGYAGYVHMPPEYQQLETQDKGALWMSIYENGLGFGGRKVGEKFIQAFKTALDKVKDSD